MNCRLQGAITAVRDAVGAACDVESYRIKTDADLINDLHFDWLELESLALILEELFNVTVPETLWKSPLYRTAETLAEWLIARSNEATWTVAKERKRA